MSKPIDYRATSTESLERLAGHAKLAEVRQAAGAELLRRQGLVAQNEMLLEIARTHLAREIETLETRRSDSLDFHDVAVWGIRAALNAAYERGRAAEREASDRGALLEANEKLHDEQDELLGYRKAYNDLVDAVREAIADDEISSRLKRMVREEEANRG